MSALLRFWKMSGAGNDFVVLDGRDPLPGPAHELARRLCPRRVAVGADGLLVVAPGPSGDVAVSYVNADGSPAEFCGNGARCAARFAAVRGMAGERPELLFESLRVRALVRERDVVIETGRPRLLGRLIWPAGDGGEIDAARVDAGVEHAVVTGADARRPLDALRAALDAHDSALSARVNVTVVDESADGSLAVRTHERGAGETLACGSGAIAAVAVVAASSGEAERVVVPPAGIPLVVSLTPEPGPVRLSGEARLVYEGSVDLDALRGT